MKYIYIFYRQMHLACKIQSTQADEMKTQQRMQPGTHMQHCVVNRRCALLAVDQWSSASRTHPFK
jgi:hypothetical protein